MLSVLLNPRRVNQLLMGRIIDVPSTEEAMRLQQHLFDIHNLLCPVWCMRSPSGIVYISMGQLDHPEYHQSSLMAKQGGN